MKCNHVKRSLALLLCLAMLFTLLPCSALAAEPESITVYVTVAKDGGFVTGKDATGKVAYVPVTVTDRNESGTYDIDDAFKALHEQYYDGTDGYSTTPGQYGLSLINFWGQYAENLIGYYLNDSSANGLAVDVKNNDHLYLFFYKDTNGRSDVYSFFDQASAYAVVNEATELTLSYVKGFDSENDWAQINSPLVGAKITINGEVQNEKVTDASGKVSLSFDSVGTYTISAVSTAKTIVPPVCKVQVVATEAELPQTLTDAQLVELAKAALTTAPITLDRFDNNAVTALQAIVNAAAKGVTVSDTLVSANSAIAANGYITRGANAVSGDVTFTINKGEAEQTVTVGVTVPAKAEFNIDTLMDTIAAGYTETFSDWEVMLGMAAYEDLKPAATAKTTATAKQNYINNTIDALSAADVAETTVSRAVIILQAIGIDPQQLYAVDSTTAFSAVEKLNGFAHSASVWSAPYTLLAYDQGSYNTASYEETLVSALLNIQQENGCWDEYGTIDTTANAILALSSRYGSDAAVKTPIDKAIAYLSSAQKPSGAYDGGYGENANSTAVVIMALCAMGIDPDTDARFIKGENSALDGLLGFAATDNSGFVDLTTKKVDGYATKQSFEALIAAKHVMTDGQPYNIYDFSHNTELAAGRATGSGTIVGPVAPPKENEDITVTFSIKVNNGYWLLPKDVTVDEGSFVYHVLLEGIAGTGISQVGAEDGYVSEMSYNGTTLGEFTEGEFTGWMYRVNGVTHRVGIIAFEVEDGNVVEFYYTMDYTKDPSSSGFVEKPQVNKEDQAAADAVSKLITDIGAVDENSAEKIKAARAAYDKLTEEQKELVEGLDKLVAAEKKLAALTGELPFSDVAADHWANKAIRFAYANDLMDGIGEGKFAPGTTLNRAMVLTMLYRMAGEPAFVVDNTKTFSDVKAGQWYSEAVAWAAANDIVTGYTDGTLGPDDNISREQLAVMLFRFADVMQHNSNKSADLSSFKDNTSVGAYAQDALEWANANGFITGRSTDIIAPKGEASRAEAATIFMRYAETFEAYKTK